MAWNRPRRTTRPDGLRASLTLALSLGVALPGALPAQGPTSADQRLRSWQRHVELESSSPFAALEWRPIGPRLAGGRIESIACPQPAGATIYAGAGSGNLWRSRNHGTTWTPIFEKESTFTIGCVAVAPTDPDVVWVGTGEVLMARSSFAGTGVFRSDDGGDSWEHKGLPDTHHIARVLIHPSDPDIVYVAALGHLYSSNEERGLFKTTDGGETWDKVLYLSDRVGVVDVAMHPSDPAQVYAVTWERDRKAWNNVENGPGSGVHLSTDAGRTWQRLTGGLPDGEHVGRIGLTIAPSDPHRLYALVDDRRPRRGRGGRPDVVGGQLYRSDDGGSSWRRTHDEPLPTAIGYDFCLVRVSPDDPDQIWVLGNYLLRSDDAGVSFARIQGTIVDLLPHGSRALHLDHHDLWIDPDDADHMLLGNDGGLYASWDRASTWLRLNNLPIAEVYAVTVDLDDPYRVYIGTQDVAALFGPADQEMVDGAQDRWQHVYLDRWGGGDSYFTYRDPTDPETIYYEHQFGDLRRKDMRDGKTGSIRPRAEPGEPPLRHNWMTPFLVSGHAPSTLYYGAQRVFRSPDRGDSWSCISPDLTTAPGPERRGDVPFGTITSLSESPLDPELLFAGTDDGRVQVTRDGGNRWHDLSDGLPDKWVSRVVASRYDPERVYVSLTGYRDDDFASYLYGSSDGGGTWASLVANLPAEPINVVREDPTDPDILYLGTDLGAYVSVDRGRSWHSLCNHLPTTPVHDLVVHPRESELVAGTHGRGVFVLDVRAIRDFDGGR